MHTRTTAEFWEKLKPLARQMRKEPTLAEDALWQRLRGKQVAGRRFRRQHPVDRFIVDFYCAAAHLVIEVDGPIHDYTPDEDAIRQQFLESLGLRVIRFRNDDVLNGIDAVLERIEAALHPQPLTPSLLREKGEVKSEESGLPSLRSGEGPEAGITAVTVTEPDWPAVDVIVGNPPFLGGKKIRTELGDYVDHLFKLYEGRVRHEADLVCYWFEKARAHIAAGRAQRAGLLATNSIRGGANREVLKRIKSSGDIFMAWSDRDWVLDGAAVRVSMVGFEGKNPQPLTPSPLRGEREVKTDESRLPSPRSG